MRTLRLAITGLVLAGAAHADVAPIAAAPGGGPLLLAAETALLTLVGVIRGRVRLDATGYSATLDVERILSGDAPATPAIRMGWEELAQGRPVRFSAGDRVAVALVPLPEQSLWRQRFPEGEAYAVASRGEAFLRAPDSETLDRIEAFLQLAPKARDERAGAERLVSLVAGAHPAIAAAALQRLDRIPGLADRLGDSGQGALVSVLVSAERPALLQASILELAGRRGLRGLRAEAARQARAGGPLEIPALVALHSLDSGLPAPRVASLLGRPQAAVRRAAVGLARGTPSESRVAELISADPDAAVRGAAVRVWVEWRGMRALGEAVPALFDPDRGVRGRAASAIGSLGAPVVPRLVELLEGRSVADAVGPVAALRQAGREGAVALEKFGREHPDPKMRTLVKLALGKPLKPH